MKLLLNLLLELCAFRAALFEAGRNHHGGSHFGFDTFPDYLRHGRGRCDDNRQIDFLRQCANGFVAVQTQNGIVLRVNRVNPAGKMALQ